ncbi:MAG: nitroreductase family protein [Candidatus Heimdallarchaeota archaeon]|nr:nitroreductase family protein [Candidatus Heimdallarchaeota archaeon]MCK4954707.1 nitroreductase family protein [Candidatus Heimdallarchaeota archaeon]
MSILEAIKNRRSIRKYKSEEVDLDMVYQIIEAGIWAPSSGNTMPFKFLILNDLEKKREFFSILLESIVRWKKNSAQKKGISITDLYENYKKYLAGIEKAPVFIFIFLDIEIGAKKFTNGNTDQLTNNNYLHNSLRDSLFLCVENMLLEASAIGLGSLYFEIPRAAKTPVNSFFNLRKSLEFFICLPIGFPDEKPIGKERILHEFLVER